MNGHAAPRLRAFDPGARRRLPWARLREWGTLLATLAACGAAWLAASEARDAHRELQGALERQAEHERTLERLRRLELENAGHRRAAALNRGAGGAK